MNSNTRDALKAFIQDVAMFVVSSGVKDADEPTKSSIRKDVLSSGEALSNALDSDETIP